MFHLQPLQFAVRSAARSGFIARIGFTLAELPTVIAVTGTLVALLPSVLLAETQFRTWTSISGKHTLEAEYVRVEEDKVILRKADGSLSQPLLKNLSEADQEFIEKMRGKDNGSSPKTNKTGTSKPPLPTEEDVKPDDMFDGGDIVKGLREEDAKVQTLEKLLKDRNYPFSILEATAALNPKPLKQNGDTLQMELKITVQANYKKFDEFRKVIEPELEKICISKTKSQIVNFDTEWCREAKTVSVRDFSSGRLVTKVNKSDDVFLHINTSRNNDFTNIQFNAYRLPDQVAATLSHPIISHIEVQLCDGNGQEVVTKRITDKVEPRANHLRVPIMISTTETFRGLQSKHYFLEPFFHDRDRLPVPRRSLERNNVFSKSLDITSSIEITLAQLAQIKGKPQCVIHGSDDLNNPTRQGERGAGNF